MTDAKHGLRWIHGMAALALVACLWIGWADADLHVPQDEVRELTRATPRLVAQLVLQFVAPVVLAGFLVREAIAARAARRGR